MNWPRESKVINLTMGVFSIFAYLMATRNRVQRFVNEAAYWHETIFAKGHLVSPSVSATCCRCSSQAVRAGNIWPAARLHWCWWRSHVEAGSVCLVCGTGSLAALLPGAHSPPSLTPQLVSELNSTSLPAVVESDRNIFYSQNVAILFSMFYFVALPWFKLYQGRKSVLKKEGSYRNKSDSSSNLFLV